MNYIKKLQLENSELANQINRTDYAINEFRVLLHSPKFCGTDLDGERKDYISTADVLNHLLIIRDRLLDTDRG